MATELDLDKILGESSKDTNQQKSSQKKTSNNQQQNGRNDSLRGVARAARMRETFRIPFVYRVKQRVLKAMLVLPLFTVYMMFAHYYGWDMGTKTYLVSLFSFMCFGGAYFFVSMIDPEDWQVIEKELRNKSVVDN